MFTTQDNDSREAPHILSDKRVAIIRTSDRINFKRCRRKWGWSSHLKQNLGPKEAVSPLWFGTGIHYALEDFHSHNKYGHPAAAFEAYCFAAYKNRHKESVPADYIDLKALGMFMMDYYELWLKDRSPLRTFWYRDQPQVEVKVLLKIPFNPKELYPDSPYDEVYYSLTIDRVVEDEDDGDLWLIDYKSAKRMETKHFAIDPQISAYYWAGHHIYPGRKIKGFIYQQHRKDVPEKPRMLASGKLSVAKQQLTTHRAYREQMLNLFGKNTQRWPQENMEFLNYLAGEETQDYDEYIRRDRIYKNEYNHESEGAKILLELEDMLNPNLALYPNPTRECVQYTCPFLNPCMSIDDDADWIDELSSTYSLRPPENDGWRKYLPDPIKHSSLCVGTY